MSKQISDDRMAVFIETISTQVRTALHERADDALKAWQENIAEAEVNGKDFPPLRYSIGACVDVEKNAIETVVRFTAAYRTSVKEELPEAGQPDPPFDPAGDGRRER